MMKRLAIILLAILSPAVLLSQGGSNYSIFGIGDLSRGFSSAYEGLGGSSIAVPFSNSMTNRNPAQWTFINSSRIQTGYRFNQNIVEDESNKLWQNNGEIEGVIINFCLDTAHGINLNTGFSSYSSVNFLVSSLVNIELAGTKYTGKTVYQGTGGITQAWIGGSYRPIDEISLGAAIFTLFGNSSKSASTLLDGMYTVPSRTYATDIFSGMGFRAGIVAEPVDNLFLGAYIEKNNNLGIDRSITYQSAYYSDSVITQKLETEMPMLIGYGLSYKTGNFVFAGDYVSQDFSNLTYNMGSAGFGKYENISFGIARLGLFGYNMNFLDRMTYMIGGGYRKSYIVLNGEQISEYYGSIGVTMPLIGMASLDAAITIGQRGKAGNGLLKESFGRLNISISLGDIWFQPYKREY